MTSKFIPQAELATLLKSTSMEVLTAVKTSPQSGRWDAIGINRRAEWIDTIEKNVSKVVQKVDKGELNLIATQFGCSLNDATLAIDGKFTDKNVSLDDKAKILFSDMAGLLVVATAPEKAQRKIGLKHLRIA
jgi:hypothetical protein